MIKGSLTTALLAFAEAMVPMDAISQIRSMGYKVKTPKKPNAEAQAAAQAKRDRKNARRAELAKRSHVGT